MKQIKYNVSTLFLFLFISQSIFGQFPFNNGTEGIEVYPPNAYALGRYGEIPVDCSSGIPNINIPLMSISDKDITVDLSLSYHATGIKVDQEATSVGLGWVLNAGGVITREIRGAVDNNQKRPVIEDFLPGTNYQEALNEYISQQIPNIQQVCRQDDFYDGESDIYYYNFNGRTGKFFLDNNNDICLFKHDNIKIENNPFTITDEAGTKYIFDKSGWVTEAGKMYTTSWYLTKIISPAGGEINFEYENVANCSVAKRAHSMCFIDATVSTGALNAFQGNNHAGVISTSYIYEPLLSKIKTNSGHYINLTVSGEKRKDSKDSPVGELKKIALYNSQNVLQKGIKLEYGYFEANTARRYKDASGKELDIYNHLNYRLRLESVKEFSTVNENVYGASYYFEYYGDDNPATDDMYTLPYRLSPAQDHWGYYNYTFNNIIFPGNSDNSYPWIEPDPWLGDSDLTLESHKIVGADREPNAEAIKAGTLNKIIYPTGGYTKFDFEINEEAGSITSGLRVKQIDNFDANGKIIHTKKYSYSGLYFHNGGGMPHFRYYHTFLYNPIKYQDANVNPTYAYLTHAFNVVRNRLSVMGVPYDLVYGKGYNVITSEINEPNPGNNEMNTKCLKVVKVLGTSPLKLGIEGKIAYSLVTEKTEGLGKTEYHYTNYTDQYDRDGTNDGNPLLSNAFVVATIGTLEDYWNQKYHSNHDGNSFDFPYPNSIDHSWKSRLLTCKRTYDADEKLVAEDSIYYNIQLLYAVPNFKAFQLSDYDYMYTRYYNVGGVVNVTKEVNKQYVTGQPVICTVKEYAYNSPHHKKPTQIITTTSQGDDITEKYYYTTEYDNYFSALKQKNILSPVDIRSYRNGKLIAGVQLQYNDAGLATVRYKYESGGTDIAFNKSNPFTFTPYLWNSYDSKNLLRTQTTKDGVSTTILWCNNGLYPLVEIKNATYDALMNSLGSSQQGFLQHMLGSDVKANDPMYISFRDMLTKALPNTLVTTYTYKPLVGMTSQTDPRGVTTYYDYDDFNRLKETYIIENGEKKVLQAYDYHYRE